MWMFWIRDLSSGALECMVLLYYLVGSSTGAVEHDLVGGAK